MLNQRVYLTNEKIRKKFDSQFDLVNYAIKLAANMIHTGRDSRLKTDSQNRATIILSEIINGKDVFDDVIVRQKRDDQHFESNAQITDNEDSSESAKEKERKKKKRKAAKD